MLVGVSAALLLDGRLLYRMFNTPPFPARMPWPPGVAVAEAIKAGDKGCTQARILLGGLGVGGAVLKLPMSAFGVALIAAPASMVAFAGTC